MASAANGPSPGEPGRLASSTWTTAASMACTSLRRTSARSISSEGGRRPAPEGDLPAGEEEGRQGGEGQGLTGGSSLAQLLAERRGVRNHLRLPRLTVEQIAAWAKAIR